MEILQRHRICPLAQNIIKYHLYAFICLIQLSYCFPCLGNAIMLKQICTNTNKPQRRWNPGTHTRAERKAHKHSHAHAHRMLMFDSNTQTDVDIKAPQPLAAQEESNCGDEHYIWSVRAVRKRTVRTDEARVHPDWWILRSVALAAHWQHKGKERMLQTRIMENARH